MQVLSLGQEEPLRMKQQPTQVFLLGNPMDRGAWWATVRGVAKSHASATKQRLVKLLVN